MANVSLFVVHHTGMGPARPTAQEVAAYQTSPAAHLPFPAMAYQLYVDAEATIQVIHDLETLTWSQGDGSTWSRDGVGGNNWIGIACCFAGQDPTDNQIAAIRRAADGVDHALGRRLRRTCHRLVSVGLTECPGSRYQEWLPKIISEEASS
jgi:hypothetical protein